MIYKKINKTFVITALIVCMFFLLTCAVNKNNWSDVVFKVDGTRILDKDGREFIIKGVNVNGPGWCFPRGTLQDIDLMIDVWEFNAVRLCAATKWDYWAKNYNKDLDPIIDAFSKKGIVVILELHDYTGIYPPLNDNGGYVTENGSEIIRPLKDLTAWWVDKANRFKNNPYVWFNIMNEPGSDNSKSSADSWFNVHETVIKAIRKTGAENIIVLDDHGYGQASGYFGGKDSYASAAITMGPVINKKYNNIIYSLHVYSSWSDGANRFENYFKDAKERGLCVIVGEFGVVKNDIGTHNAVRNMYNSVIPHNIGRLYWAWDDGGLPMTTGENGRGYMIDKKNGIKPENLTWAGEMVWLDNRGLLNAPVPMYALNRPLLVNGDFENGMDSWDNWGMSSVIKNASIDSSAALLISSGGQGGCGQTLALETNTTYTFTVWGKGFADMGVKYRTNEEDANELHNTISFDGNTWVQKSITFTTSQEIYGPILFIWKGSAGETFNADNLTLVKN